MLNIVAVAFYKYYLILTITHRLNTTVIPVLADKDTETERLGNLLSITQLVAISGLEYRKGNSKAHTPAQTPVRRMVDW